MLFVLSLLQTSGTRSASGLVSSRLEGQILTRLLRLCFDEIGGRRGRLRPVQERTCGESTCASTRYDSPKGVFRATFCRRTCDLYLQRAAILHSPFSSTGICQRNQATDDMVSGTRYSSLPRRPRATGRPVEPEAVAMVRAP